MTDTVTLFLMTQKGYAVLDALSREFPHLIASVVSSRDPNVRKDYYDEMRALCAERGLPFHDRSEGLPTFSTYAMSISWRWMLDLVSTRLIVFHDSLLPRYRGFNPLVTALINGDEEIGVTALFAAGEYDRGDILAQSSTRISYPIKIQQAIELVAHNYVELALAIARRILEGETLQGTPQVDAQATYSLWRDEEDYRIDWTRSADQIRRFVDAVGYPYKGASTLVNGHLARVLDVEVLPDVRIENRVPGKVIFMRERKPVVVCGSGLLRIDTLVDDADGRSLLPLAKFRTRFC